MKPTSLLSSPIWARIRDGVPASLPSGMHSLLLATLSIYVAVLPIAHTIALRGLMFLVLIVLTLALLEGRRKWPRFPLWQAWLAYVTVGMVAVWLAIDPAKSLGEFRSEFIYCFIIFIIGSIWGEQFAAFRVFAWILAAANFVLVLFAFAFAGLAMPPELVLRIPPIAYAGLNTNWIITVIFLHVWLILQLWRERQRVLPLILAGLIGLDLWAMMVGYNRQTWLALGAGTACWGMAMLYRQFSWRRLVALAFVLVALFVLFSVQQQRRTGSASSASLPGTVATSAISRVQAQILSDPRWEIWRFSIKKIAEHPLVGGGPGRYVFRRLYPEFHADIVNDWHAHNMILNKGIQMGVPGMLAFLLLWLSLARELGRHARSSETKGGLAVAGLSVVVAVFVKNMTDDFFVRDSALMFWLVMGLLIGVLRSSQQPPTAVVSPNPDSLVRPINNP